MIYTFLLIAVAIILALTIVVGLAEISNHNGSKWSESVQWLTLLLIPFYLLFYVFYGIYIICNLDNHKKFKERK